MKYWRKDLVWQEETFDGHPLEILFLIQMLEQKDHNVFMVDGDYYYNNIFGHDIEVAGEEEEDDEHTV